MTRSMPQLVRDMAAEHGPNDSMVLRAGLVVELMDELLARRKTVEQGES